ncbi:MAG: aldehyde dehydrogenase family protein [Bacteroidetes bacterium]|nr:aldehyde dehydrogenase family protein [Bacteroidota bacterium]MDA1120798.1 aldehyde dehydrogenase family protein [Bacteroidota bacterium]
MSRFQIISPVNNSIYAEREYASTSQIEHVLSKSVDAQKKWKNVPLSERKAICQNMVGYFIDHIDQFATELTWMMGRPIKYAPLEIKGGFKERADYMINSSEQALADIVPEVKTGFKRYIKKEPLGTVLVLSPWNYPYLTSVNAVIPAILAGNSVILKHADQTAICAERYLEAFKSSGIPDSVFQYLHLTHDQAGEIIRDNRIAHVAFTGSVDGGKAVQQSGSHRFINVGLELGGKDAAYVREDADLKFSVDNLVDGSYFNSGQSCCGIERIYVHESIYEKFVTQFAQTVMEYNLGNPTSPEVTLGPMVSSKVAAKVKAHIQDAIDKGARRIIDTSDFPKHLGEQYMPPQVLVGVDHTMDIMTEETFGPVVGIMPVKDDEQAIAFINDSQYGLTASIWTADDEKAVEIGDQIECGTVFMNRCDYLDPALAWTGVKHSGKGCTLSPLAFDQFVRPKSYHLRIP